MADPRRAQIIIVPLAAGLKRIVEIVESGVYIDDFNKPRPEYGHSVHAVAGARGPGRVAFSVSTSRQSFAPSFGEYNLASDLSIVTYPRFKAALLAINSAWDAQWAYANARRNDVVKVPVAFASGVPAFRVDSAPPVPLDSTFPKSVFHVPWIVYLAAERAGGVTLTGKILTERTPEGGLVMSATTDRLDPTNPEHVRRARGLAETLIASIGNAS